MKINLSGLLKDYVASLQKIYKNKLRQVILFGSYARGDYHEDSDIDVMILLDMDEQDIYGYNNILCEATSEIDAPYDMLISPITINFNKFYKLLPIHVFYQNVKNEGVILYEG